MLVSFRSSLNPSRVKWKSLKSETILLAFSWDSSRSGSEFLQMTPECLLAPFWLSRAPKTPGSWIISEEDLGSQQCRKDIQGRVEYHLYYYPFRQSQTSLLLMCTLLINMPNIPSLEIYSFGPYGYLLYSPYWERVYGLYRSRQIERERYIKYGDTHCWCRCLAYSPHTHNTTPWVWEQK